MPRKNRRLRRRKKALTNSKPDPDGSLHRAASSEFVDARDSDSDGSVELVDEVSYTTHQPGVAPAVQLPVIQGKIVYPTNTRSQGQNENQTSKGLLNLIKKPPNKSKPDRDGNVCRATSSEFVDALEMADEVSNTTHQAGVDSAVHLPVIQGKIVYPPSTRSQQQRENQTSKDILTGSRKRNFTGAHTLMHLAALKGDWQGAEVLLHLDPNIIHAEITENGDMALHVAAAMKQTKFVRELVERMSREDLLNKNDNGYTAFCFAAASGVVKIAALMREKNESLLTMRGNNSMTPIYMAALLGHTEMVSYLYGFTRSEDLQTKEWFDLLLATIRNKMYGVALDMVKQNGCLATMTNKQGTALHMLAAHDLSETSSGLKRILKKNLMQRRAWLLADKMWAEIQKLEPMNAHELIKTPPLLQHAAKVGNVSLITMLTRSNPNLIWGVDTNKYTIFHIAVMHRQESVFRLIHQTGAMRHLITSSTDGNGDNILHLAAELAPPSRRKIVSGAALQMQRELIWFKEVKKIVPTSCLEMRNKQGYRPSELFSKRHMLLLKEGETWMKETSNSCTLMATLLATVVFAAAFTVPGGNNGETGKPILLERSWFTVFVVSDAVAMFASTSSIIMFLSILTSRYQQRDFMVSLPTKLMLGLTALFVSIASTIIAFTSTFFLLFNGETAWLAKWVAAFACVSLVTLFGILHFRLWVDTICSTYWSRFVFRKDRHNSLY